MSKPTQSGKKYLQLTDNILLEYTYVLDRYDNNNDIDEDLLGYADSSIDNDELIAYGTYGRASHDPSNNTNKYVIAKNNYTNELYFMNDEDSQLLTNNSMRNTVLPVKKDSSQWVRTLPSQSGEYYSKYDEKWCAELVHGEEDLIVLPGSETGSSDFDEYVPYDIVRIYFQSGYHSDYDGFIFNIYTKDKTNRYVNLLSVIHENHDDVKLTSEPMWFADKIYSTYIEYRIPSTAYLSSDCVGGASGSMEINHWGDYDRAHPEEGTLPYILTNRNSIAAGFYSNPAIGIDVYGVIGYSEKREFKILKARAIVSTLFPNKDSYDKLFACVRDSNDGDYYELYGYYENDPFSPTYDEDSLYQYLSKFDGTFTIAHIITVSENWVDEDNNPQVTVHTPITYIQTWEMLENSEHPIIKFRPILEHTSSMLGSSYGATISYTLRITSNRDGTSIIKSGSTTILQPRRFGKNLSNAIIYGENNIRVYNRIEQGPELNISAVISPIAAPKSSSNEHAAIQVNKYVTSSFIDRRNIRVSIAPVRINNVEE